MNIEQIAKECGFITCAYEGVESISSIEDLQAFAQAIIKAYVAEQEPMGWWRQGVDLDESDYYPADDFPDLDTEGCIPLYDLKEMENKNDN